MKQLSAVKCQCAHVWPLILFKIQENFIISQPEKSGIKDRTFSTVQNYKVMH